MGFYFIVHTFLGLTTISANLLVLQGRSQIGSVPLWVHRFGPLFATAGLLSCIAALVTTLVNHELLWTGITLAEMALGAFLATMLPMGMRAFLVVTSPLSIPFILGALWKFWYI